MKTEDQLSDAAFTITKKASDAKVARALVLGAVLIVSCYAVSVFAQRGIVNTNGVNLRTGMDPEYSSIGIINAGEEIEITSQTDDFYQVTVNGLEHLYIPSQYLDVEDERTTPSPLDVTAPIQEGYNENSSGAGDVYAPNSRYALVVSDDGLNLRTGPSLNAGIILTLPYGAAVDVLDVWPVWTKVSYNGTVGFMKSEFVELHTGEKPVQAPVDTNLASQVIAYGKRFIGTPYRWGGTNLSKGVDCSGFVYSVYKNFGVSLNRSSASMSSNGVRVNKADLQMGDLVFFDTNGANNGRISHVGIYIGNGQFIHSSSSKRTWGVVISGLNEDYYIRTYVTARRVI